MDLINEHKKSWVKTCYCHIGIYLGGMWRCQHTDPIQLIHVIKSKMITLHETFNNTKLWAKIVAKPNPLHFQVCWLNNIDNKNIWLVNWKSFKTISFIQILGFKQRTCVLSAGMRTTKSRAENTKILMFLKKMALRFGSNFQQSLLLAFLNDHFRQVFSHKGGNLKDSSLEEDIMMIRSHIRFNQMLNLTIITKYKKNDFLKKNLNKGSFAQD